jgi:hypothetical protein
MLSSLGLGKLGISPPLLDGTCDMCIVIAQYHCFAISSIQVCQRLVYGRFIAQA